MKGLKITLWFTAVCCLSGFALAALPWKAMTALCGWAGIQAPSAMPLTVFIYRLFSAVIGVIGIFFVMLARNPLKYGGMLSLAAYGISGYGIFALFGGMRYGFPAWTYSLDFTFGVVVGILLIIFRKKALRTNSFDVIPGRKIHDKFT